MSRQNERESHDIDKTIQDEEVKTPAYSEAHEITKYEKNGLPKKLSKSSTSVSIKNKKS